MTDPTPEERAAVLAATYCLAVAGNKSTNRLEAAARRILETTRAAEAAMQERCERAANEEVMAALSDMVPDHFDDEGRRDGYTISAMMTIATRVVLAIRALGTEEGK